MALLLLKSDQIGTYVFVASKLCIRRSYVGLLQCSPFLRSTSLKVLDIAGAASSTRKPGARVS